MTSDLVSGQFADYADLTLGKGSATRAANERIADFVMNRLNEKKPIVWKMNNQDHDQM